MNANQMLRTARWVSLAGGVLLLGACAASPPAKKSLYERLGAEPAITAVVDELVVNIAADTRINQRFKAINMAKLKANLVDQLCMASGGPCTYKGRDMVRAHKGQDISDADFDALVEDLVKALDKFKVPAQEKGELLALLSPMRGDIVGK